MSTASGLVPKESGPGLRLGLSEIGEKGLRREVREGTGQGGRRERERVRGERESEGNLWRDEGDEHAGEGG